MRHEILSPKLDLAPFPQLSRIPRITKRLAQTSFVGAFSIPTGTSGIGRRRVRIRIRIRVAALFLPARSPTQIRSEIDQIDFLFCRRAQPQPQRLIIEKSRLGEQVLGIEGRKEGFKEFHLGQLSFEGVPEEDGKVFGCREQGGELENLQGE
jgi:hypothetical protein